MPALVSAVSVRPTVPGPPLRLAITVLVPLAPPVKVTVGMVVRSASAFGSMVKVFGMPASPENEMLSTCAIGTEGCEIVSTLTRTFVPSESSSNECPMLGVPPVGAKFIGERNVTVTGELVLPLMVAVTESEPRTLLVQLTLQMPVVASVVQVFESSEPTPGVENVTGAPVVGVAVGLPSVAVTVNVVVVVPGRSTVVRFALKATLTTAGWVPSTQALKCGRAALIVWATVSTVDGTATARPLGST